MPGFVLLLLPQVLALGTREPPPPAAISRTEPVEGWVTVRLNHFDASNTETFQMRYFYNSELASSNHIVIFVGGEWAISTGWTRAGLAYELAERINAGVFYTEHRYYGETRPTNTTTVDELRYLNVDQALGDLAQFIQYVKSDAFENGRYRDGNVALVGCSYAGSMATWMRLAYPHLTTVAFSDSGPLHAQEDFPEYLEVITEALRVQGGQQCVDAIADAMEMVTELLTAPAGVERVSNLFNTCSLLQASSPLDVATFFWYGITETFAGLVQYAVPGDIPAACAVITNSSLGDPVERLAAWITSDPWTQPCIEPRYDVVVAGHSNTSYDAPDSWMRLWTYQTCVEYGWYQTTSGEHQPFLKTVPLEYFHQMCQNFYSSDFTQELLRAGVARTNLKFAGLSFMPDHVISVAGAHDPWSPMGPSADHATKLSPVYVVDGISHCRAIRPTENSESAALAAAQQAALLHMEQLMDGWRAAAPRAIPAALLLLLAAALVPAAAAR